MIYITGDTHGGFQRFGSKYFPQQTQMGRNDYMIICGDFGGLWDGGQKDQHWLDWLAEKPFTTLFVDGNHENFDLLNALPEKEWHGGRVHEVRENILHLMRGQIFTFGGLTWFTMGGASSHDIQDGVLDPEAPDFVMPASMSTQVRPQRIKAALPLLPLARRLTRQSPLWLMV